MPPKRSGSKNSTSRAASQNNNNNNNNNNNAGSGRSEWEALVERLGAATLESFDETKRQQYASFDPKDYIQQQEQSHGRNEFSDAIGAAGSNIQAFLDEKQDEFEREILGRNDGNVALPLYVARVNMVEATHVMPAEPTATDSFRFHSLPEKIANLPNTGPNWVAICNNAVEAVNFRMKLKQQQQQQLLQQQQAATAGTQQQQLPKEIRLTKLSAPGKVADFIPIILLTGGASSTVQLSNVKDLLENGQYTPPFQQWTQLAGFGEPHLARRDEKRDTIFVSPERLLADPPAVKFRQFRVIDDPADVDNWDHVCACFVSPTGHLWQFEGWYGGTNTEKNQPRNIFDVHLKGFMPYFEDDKTPNILKEWKVVPLLLSRRNSKSHMSIRAARIFWESLFEFMETHAFFRQYTLEPTNNNNNGRR